MRRVLMVGTVLMLCLAASSVVSAEVCCRQTQGGQMCDRCRFDVFGVPHCNMTFSLASCSCYAEPIFAQCYTSGTCYTSIKQCYYDVDGSLPGCSKRQFPLVVPSREQDPKSRRHV